MKDYDVCNTEYMQGGPTSKGSERGSTQVEKVSYNNIRLINFRHLRVIAKEPLALGGDKRSVYRPKLGTRLGRKW